VWREISASVSGNKQLCGVFDASRKTAPVSWRADELAVCLCCGELFAYVPDAPLTELRRDAAEAP
jgi:hypothetical protein